MKVPLKGFLESWLSPFFLFWVLIFRSFLKWRTLQPLIHGSSSIGGVFFLPSSSLFHFLFHFTLLLVVFLVFLILPQPFIHSHLHVLCYFLLPFGGLCFSSSKDLIKILNIPKNPYQMVSRAKGSTKLMKMFITINGGFCWKVKTHEH